MLLNSVKTSVEHHVLYSDVVVGQEDSSCFTIPVRDLVLILLPMIFGQKLLVCPSWFCTGGVHDELFRELSHAVFFPTEIQISPHTVVAIASFYTISANLIFSEWRFQRNNVKIKNR